MSTLRSPAALARAGLVDLLDLPALERVAARYAVAVTRDLIELIDAADPADPVAAQYLPHAAELDAHPLERADPIGDAAHSPVAGIVHRYPDRVLLKPTHACAVYCRFCFRREVVGPGGEGALSPAGLDAALAYVAARPKVWEVVVTGGDPLALSPRRLADLGARLAEIEHVKVVRFHTRLPVVAPARVTPALARALRASGKSVWVAVHANHAREFTPAARDACARLSDAGVPLLGQTVLLAGVNDTPEALEALMRAMVEARIKPYYLHHPDLAPGTARFRLPVEDGRALVRGLRGRVSGLCQPTYVLDIPGGHGKAPLGPDHWRGGQVEDPWGEVHAYPPPPAAED